MPSGSELSVLLTDNARIQELNRDYRGLDKPTDVLSFSQDGEDGLLGDIVISVETAKSQADSATWPLESELALLGVHGFLHLVGHDDETENGAHQMERLTRDILKSATISLPPGDHPFFQEEGAGDLAA